MWVDWVLWAFDRNCRFDQLHTVLQPAVLSSLRRLVEVNISQCYTRPWEKFCSSCPTWHFHFKFLFMPHFWMLSDECLREIKCLSFCVITPSSAPNTFVAFLKLLWGNLQNVAPVTNLFLIEILGCLVAWEYELGIGLNRCVASSCCMVVPT